MTALGSDFAGSTDLHYDLRLSSGRSALGEALLRRYQTQRGALWYAPDYGLGLTRFANAKTPEASVAQLIEREALKDERVLEASSTVTRAGETLDVQLTITDDAGPFDLTLAVSDLTVTLLLPT